MFYAVIIFVYMLYQLMLSCSDLIIFGLTPFSPGFPVHAHPVFVYPFRNGTVIPLKKLVGYFSVELFLLHDGKYLFRYKFFAHPLILMHVIQLLYMGQLRTPEDTYLVLDPAQGIL